jgi:hypothetical protein
MDNTTHINPTIAELLDEFFRLYKPTAARALRARIDLVRSHLGVHLEDDGPRELTTPQLIILEADKAFDPHGAFTRTMHAPELYYALARYLRPDSAMPGDAQRHTQVDVVAALAQFLWSRRLISLGTVSECDIIEFDIAMERARNVRRRSRSK